MGFFRWIVIHKFCEQQFDGVFVEFILSPAMHMDSWLKSWSSIVYWGECDLKFKFKPFSIKFLMTFECESVLFFCPKIRFNRNKVDRAPPGTFQSTNFQLPKKLYIMPALKFICFVHVISTKYSRCRGNWARWLFGNLILFCLFISKNWH